MASSNPSRFSTVAVFSASVVAAATVSGLVAYYNGDTYTAGTQEATTLSGATVTADGGVVTINSSGYVGKTIEATQTISGAVLKSFPNSGSGKVLLYGAKGGTLCIFDTDAGGYSQCDTLNGTMTCRIASAGQCP